MAVWGTAEGDGEGAVVRGVWDRVFEGRLTPAFREGFDTG